MNDYAGWGDDVGPNAVRYVKLVRPTAPGAGNDWSIAVPGGFRWDVVSLMATFTTSAVVANRFPVVYLSDGTTTYLQQPSLGPCVASGVYYLNWQANGSAYNPTGFQTWQNMPLPCLTLPTGHVLSVATTNLDVGDAWSAIRLLVRESVTGPEDPPRPLNPADTV